MTTITRLLQRFRRLRRWQQAAISLFALVVISASALYVWAFADLPSIDNISAGLALPSTRILDRHGRQLYEVIDPQGGRHTAVPLEAIPQSCIDATIATEDRNFYHTPGIDVEGVIRALWINVQGGEIRAGGSTITQQVVRNLLIDPQQRAERSLRRKLREMVLAVQLANTKSHEEILALYLNQTYYGNLAYGIDAAAQVYFDKSAVELTLAECALLAGLPQTPARYDPLTNPEAAKTRQRVVLDLMVSAGYLTAESADAAHREKLQYGDGQFEMNAPHFVQMIWSQLERDYPDVLYQGGLEVITTLDLDWQRAAEAAALRQMIALNKPLDGKPPHNVHGAAVVAIDPKTGQVMALLGNVNYDDGTQDRTASAINMALAPRQPGSTLKPFTYALTFDPAREQPWTPATMILDVSTPFITRQLESYTPANYGLAEHGPVLIREALASSYNIPAVVALHRVGVSSLVDLLHKLGVTTLNDPTRIDLSLTLGGGDVRLLDLTAAYAALANEGRPVSPKLLLKVSDKTGTVLYEWQPAPIADRVLDAQVVHLITDILSDNEARRPSFGDHSALSIGRPAAAKTGTTTDYRDNWTVGYTPDLVVGVWAGNPDNTPMIDVSGVTGAGPIWNEFMRQVLKDTPETPFTPPPGLVQAEVCAASGLLPTQYCPQKRLDWFIAGTVPTEYDTMFQPFTIDRRTGLLATDETPPADRVVKVFKVLPQEARLWGLRHGVEPPPASPEQVRLYPQSGFRLLTPDPYTIYQLTPVIPFDAQKIRFSVAVVPGTVRVAYWLNGEPLETVTADPWWAWWALIPGDYTLTAQATLTDGTTRDAPPLTFTVVTYVPPDARPSAGTARVTP